MRETAISSRPLFFTLTASALILAACGPEKAAPGKPDRDAAEHHPAPILPDSPAPTLTRSNLLQAMDVAAAAYAAGQEVRGSSLVGRRFAVRQSFGCSGPTRTPGEANVPDGLPDWSRDERRQAEKLTLAPVDWTGASFMDAGSDDWEAVEGFWLTRPWMRADGCPRSETAPPNTDHAGSSPQTAGLAAVFEEDGSRLGRRNGRAYQFTLRDHGDQAASSYRLVLEGRMTSFANGQAIRCHAAGIDQRPVCIGAVKLDRVAFEDAGGKTLSEWVGG
ncbi:MAG: hypothetical protein EON89_11255 [Brevundimonas sp.]|nr:MAG: hypothetical protein EON89_11255 [Brevundimonas sp.]